MMKGAGFLGLGIILFVLGICLYAGVIVTQVPILGWIAWIPMSIGGIFIVVGLVLIIIRK